MTVRVSVEHRENRPSERCGVSFSATSSLPTVDEGLFYYASISHLARTQRYVSAQHVLSTLAQAVDKFSVALSQVLLLVLICQLIYAFQNGKILLRQLTHVVMTWSVARVAVYCELAKL